MGYQRCWADFAFLGGAYEPCLDILRMVSDVMDETDLSEIVTFISVTAVDR